MQAGAAPGSVSSTMSLRKPLGSRKGSSRLDMRAFRPDSSSRSCGSAAPNWSCSRSTDCQFVRSLTPTSFQALLRACQTGQQQGKHARCPRIRPPVLHLMCDATILVMPEVSEGLSRAHRVSKQASIRQRVLVASSQPGQPLQCM